MPDMNENAETQQEYFGKTPKELSKGFTRVEINGVKFSNIREMLIYMNKQRDRIVELETQIEKMKCCGNCSKYDRYNRMCSRTRFSVIETLCNCSDDWELRK